MLTAIKLVTSRLGIDKAVGYTILTRGLQAVGGLVSVVFVTKYLSIFEQGYYYTFASIIAIQVFFELGLSGIIMQYAAHEFAHLTFTDIYQVEGDIYYKSRLSSLLRFCIKWFGIFSFLLFFLLLLVGRYFFSKFNNNLNVGWQAPWFILCISTALNLFIDPILSFFDGIGEVKAMAKLRLIQKSFYLIMLYVLLALDFKLYSAAIASLLSILINYCQFFFSKRRSIINQIWKLKNKWVINYRKEIFPFQWKTALSWISGYLIFQLFSPVLFITDGAIAAGQMGVSLAALNGIMSISLSWITTKIPLFSKYIAKKNFEELDKVFEKLIKQSSFVCFLALAFFLISVIVMRSMNLRLGYRFLNIIPLLLLCGSTFISQYVFALASYLRSHKQEPFLGLSLTMGALSGLSTILLGKYFGVMGMTAGYFILTLTISLFGSIWIFKKKKKLWHQEAS